MESNSDLLGDALPEYLAENFDPSKLSVPALSSLLSREGVVLPPTKQKKDVYIQLFNNQIAANRKRLIDSHRKKLAIQKDIQKRKRPSEAFYTVPASSRDHISFGNVRDQDQPVDDTERALELASSSLVAVSVDSQDSDFDEFVEESEDDSTAVEAHSGPHTPNHRGSPKKTSDISYDNPFQTPPKATPSSASRRKSTGAISNPPSANQSDVDSDVAMLKTPKKKVRASYAPGAHRPASTRPLQIAANPSPQPFNFRAHTPKVTVPSFSNTDEPPPFDSAPRGSASAVSAAHPHASAGPHSARPSASSRRKSVNDFRAKGSWTEDPQHSASRRSLDQRSVVLSAYHEIDTIDEIESLDTYEGHIALEDAAALGEPDTVDDSPAAMEAHALPATIRPGRKTMDPSLLAEHSSQSSSVASVRRNSSFSELSKTPRKSLGVYTRSTDGIDGPLVAARSNAASSPTAPGEAVSGLKKRAPAPTTPPAAKHSVAEATTDDERPKHAHAAGEAPATPKPPKKKKAGRRSSVRRKDTTLPPKGSGLWMLWLALAVLLGYGYFDWRNGIEGDMGYCGPNKEDQRPSYKGYNPFGYALPTCIPCPERGTCTESNLLACEGDYYLAPNWVTSVVGTRGLIYSLLPFPWTEPTCKPDLKKIAKEQKEVQQIRSMTNALEEIVRRWTGQFECKRILQIRSALHSPKKQDPHLSAEGNIWSEDGRHVLGMPLSTAKNSLKALIGTRWDDVRFEEQWKLVLKRINTTECLFDAPPRPESESAASTSVTSATPASSPTLTDAKTKPEAAVIDSDLSCIYANQQRMLRSSKPPIMPLSCRISRSLLDWISKHFLELSVAGFTIFGVAFYWGQAHYARQESKMISELVDDVLEALHQEGDNHFRDPVRYPIPGLSTNQLRDHFLPVHKKLGSPSLGRSESAVSDGEGLESPSALASMMNKKRFNLDPQQRQKVWIKVSEMVLLNSNVRETSMDICGEQHPVWQWIGSQALAPKKAMSSIGTGGPYEL
ncbi:Man1-Src1p-C-terminal domain-containing protein [Polychytrium aggregatum]|uniref:Man1-Src1p-C-terminal domain-containing protein n=1 Tax=Polychytrium aggregatum TaxID=110093 RepID=UPI0022FDC887|nr:Man1-Src1p-C-terminal domain-containing protein [Polychytrium aggregatum]KAI9205619.1 Man1-Src1p-C-terminal domain-containing protein [Polychytrium aggregatum]